MRAKALAVFRPLNLIILVLNQALAYSFLGPRTLRHELLQGEATSFYLLSLATCLIAAAGYLINDLFDEAVDHINKPHKTPIQYWNRRNANVVYLLFNLTAIGIGWYLGNAMLQVMIATPLLLYLYSARFQKLPLIGNLMVAFLAALSLLILKFIAPEIASDILLFFAGFAFLTSLIREIVKDIQDMEGDQVLGYQTVPIVWGLPTSRILIFILSLLGLTGYIWGALKYIQPYVNPGALIWFHAYAIAFIIIPFLVLTIAALRTRNHQKFAALSALCKYLMYTGVLSMGFV